MRPLSFRPALVLPLGLTLAALVAPACKAYPPGDPAGTDAPCEDDYDCVGDRICVGGVCRSPGSGAGGGAGGAGGGGAGGAGGGGAGGDGGAGGGPGCVPERAACGCDGQGFGDGLTELHRFACDGGSTLDVFTNRDPSVVELREGDRFCRRELRACERDGLARLLDEAFTGCEPGPGACEAGSAEGLFVCRDLACIAYPLGRGSCGEVELQAVLARLADSLRDDAVACAVVEPAGG